MDHPLKIYWNQSLKKFKNSKDLNRLDKNSRQFLQKVGLPKITNYILSFHPNFEKVETLTFKETNYIIIGNCSIINDGLLPLCINENTGQVFKIDLSEEKVIFVNSTIEKFALYQKEVDSFYNYANQICDTKGWSLNKKGNHLKVFIHDFYSNLQKIDFHALENENYYWALKLMMDIHIFYEDFLIYADNDISF